MTTPHDPRVCIIGAGSLATRRIYPYIGAAGGRLVGVCDLDAAKAERNAARFGGKVFRDFAPMLDELRPDGVMICIGPEAHAELAARVLAAGYPVYTEKPPAASADAAFAVAQLARDRGLLCFTAFKKRHTEAAGRAKQWLAGFPEADRYSLAADYCSAQYKNDTPRSSFLLDFGIHMIDLTQYLFGDVEAVFAFAKGPDAYAVSLRFTTGAVGSLNLNDGRSFALPTEEVELTVKGGNFMTIRNSASWRITENGKATEWREPPTFVSAGDSGRDTGHLAEIEDFFAALKEGRRAARSDIYESYKTLALYEAIARSAQTGAVVPVRYLTL